MKLLRICLDALFMSHDQCTRHWTLKKKKKMQLSSKRRCKHPYPNEAYDSIMRKAICSKRVIAMEVVIEPSTIPSLLFASNAIRIALAQLG